MYIIILYTHQLRRVQRLRVSAATQRLGDIYRYTYIHTYLYVYHYIYIRTRVNPLFSVSPCRAYIYIL